jgi:spermidine synthase
MQLAKHIDNSKLLYLNQSYGNKSADAISINENHCFRWIAFGDVIQSVMHKRKPWLPTLPHQTIMLLPLIFFKPQNIIELGLGGGNLARFLSHLSDKISFTSVECNSVVIDCFEQYFNPQNAPISIIHNRAETWLMDKKLSKQHTKSLDWLICDVYQQQLIDFKETINLLEVFMSSISSNTCLSINLPDANDQEVNLCLTILHQLQSNHRILYFHVPNYLNIVIHIIPEHWPVDFPNRSNKHSYLNKRIYKRALTFWSYFKKTTPIPD